MRQIEHMESEELSMQKRLRTECIQLEDQLSQVRKEYEMLRIEFEQTLAANEQTGPINREMRHLITSLQNHNQQLKGENQRLKKKLKEAQHEAMKLKHQLEHITKEEKAKHHPHEGVIQATNAPGTSPSRAPPTEPGAIVKEELGMREETKLKVGFYIFDRKCRILFVNN